MSNIPSKAKLYELYWSNGLSINEIADRCDTQEKIVRGWFQAYGVPYGETENRSAYAFRQLSDQRLYELCWDEKRSSSEIAEQYDIGKALVNRQYNERGIPTPHGGHHNAWVFRMLSRHCLYELYWGEGLTQRQIAERFDVSPNFVQSLYQEREIPQEPARPPEFSGDSIPQGYEWPDDHPRADDSHHQHEPLPENPDGSKYLDTDSLTNNKKRLYELYWGYGCSLKHIAAMTEVTSDTIRRRLHSFGIPVRVWSNHLRWEPHHGVPPKYEWPHDHDVDEDEASVQNGIWRQPAAE